MTVQAFHTLRTGQKLILGLIILKRVVTNLRAALARLPHRSSCGGFLYLLVGSTGCGGNEQGFEEGISKLVYRAGEGIFLVTVSTVFVCLLLTVSTVFCFTCCFHRVLLYLTISPVLCPFVTSVF